MPVTSLENLLYCMFKIPIERVKINQDYLPIDFENRLEIYCNTHDINMYMIDFEGSTKPFETFIRSVTKEYCSVDSCVDLKKVFNKINYEEHNVLFIIKNLEVLTCLEESFTFTLRSWLTVETTGKIKVIFVSKQCALDKIFNEPKAALYHAALEVNELV